MSRLDFKRNLTLRDKFALTKSSLKVKFDCTFLCYSLQNTSDILGHEAIGKEDVDQKCYKRETNQSWDAWDYLQEFHKYSIE